VLKLARFRMLNSSVRNCKLSFSRRRVSLSKEKSQAGAEEMRPLVARESWVASVVAAGEAQLRVGSEAALPPGNAARRGLSGKEAGAANPIIQIFIPQFD
jgi:hypothetical protein